MEDLVSVVVPVFNRPRLVREAVASVVAQSYRPIETIVVDDGSTDETAEVCASLAQAHPDVVHTVRIPHSGPGRAREAGRLLARGEFIQYLDSDDVLHPAKFERQVGALRGHPECGVAYCATRESRAGGVIDGRASARTGEQLEALFPDLLSGRCWQTVSPLFRRSITDAIGPWSELGQEEDWEYDARAAALGVRLAWCPEFLADFRHHDSPRAGGGSLRNRQRMWWRYRAHVLIYGHAVRFGIGPSNPHMRHYARELFLLARQCGAAGLPAESRELFELARSASGNPRRNGVDFLFYRCAAALVGWRTVGWLACWTDRLRPRPAA